MYEVDKAKFQSKQLLYSFDGISTMFKHWLTVFGWSHFYGTVIFNPSCLFPVKNEKPLYQRDRTQDNFPY